jgi:hypothetical protein
MNANELADELIKINEYYNLEEEEMEQAATMLRQQQAEIEELIKHLEFAGITVERKAQEK